VRDGLVKRAEHAEDRRQTVLTLTGKGQTLWRKLSPLYEALVGEIFGAVPNKQRSGFINNLDLLYAALKNEDEEIPAPSLREHLARLASDSKTRKPPLAS
jgi:DNA-binding MarR family transcriptional regulator